MTDSKITETVHTDEGNTNNSDINTNLQHAIDKKKACRKIDGMLNMLQHTSVQIKYFIQENDNTVTADNSYLEQADFDFLVEKVEAIKQIIQEHGFMEQASSESEEKQKLQQSLTLAFTVLEKNAYWLQENFTTDTDLLKSITTFMKMIEQCKGFFELPM